MFSYSVLSQEIGWGERLLFLSGGTKNLNQYSVTLVMLYLNVVCVCCWLTVEVLQKLTSSLQHMDSSSLALTSGCLLAQHRAE